MPGAINFQAATQDVLKSCDSTVATPSAINGQLTGHSRNLKKVVVFLEPEDKKVILRILLSLFATRTLK